jgi:hypothetical protein
MATVERNAGMSENTSKGSPVKMAVLLALHAVCGVIVFYLLLVWVPQYEKIFKDFGMKLPEMTVLVIKLSQLFAGYWYVLVSGLGAVDMAIMFSLNRIRQIGLMTAWGLLVCLAQMLLMGLIVAAVTLPMNDLITRLSQ